MPVWPRRSPVMGAIWLLNSEVTTLRQFSPIWEQKLSTPNERHIGAFNAAVTSRVGGCGTLRVAPLTLCDLHAHGRADILLDRLQILDGHSHRVGFFLLCGGPILILHSDNPGALLVGNETVRKPLANLLIGAIRTEVQIIKDGLDTVFVKAIFFLCQFSDIFHGLSSWTKPIRISTI